jgi:hypothetical protein
MIFNPLSFALAIATPSFLTIDACSSLLFSKQKFYLAFIQIDLRSNKTIDPMFTHQPLSF